jgi:hypothetical protein
VDRTASRRNACTKTSPQALDEPAALLLRFFLDFGFETEYGMATNGSKGFLYLNSRHYSCRS